jgi:hypothetical protein
MKQVIFLFVVFFLTTNIFHSCLNEKQIFSEEDQQSFTRKGDSLSKLTFDTLRNTLLRKILTNGVAGAVRFCQVGAGPLTTIYASEGIDIARTSSHFRNHANKPDSISLDVLENMQAAIRKGEKPVVQVFREQNGTVHYFKPILMQAMCLNCHGSVPGQVQPDVVKVIDSLYPGDLARQYKEGELRGAWHIQFKERLNR